MASDLEGLSDCFLRHESMSFRKSGETRIRKLSVFGSLVGRGILWPYLKDRDGYGIVGCAKSNLPSSRAHRLICVWTHGPVEDPRLQASHACGSASCVNPNHIRWLDVGDNNRERRIHGTMPKGATSGSAKLTEEQIAGIRNDTRRQVDIAASYGCSQTHVSRIKRGESR